MDQNRIAKTKAAALQQTAQQLAQVLSVLFFVGRAGVFSPMIHECIYIVNNMIT
jgi:hypothetical protein